MKLATLKMRNMDLAGSDWCY